MKRTYIGNNDDDDDYDGDGDDGYDRTHQKQ